MGTEAVDRFLPGMEDSIIKVSDFESPRALASYVKKVAADENCTTHTWTGKHVVLTTVGRKWKLCPATWRIKMQMCAKKCD